MLACIPRASLKYPVTVDKPYPRLGRWSTDLSRTEYGHSLLFQAFLDVVSFVIISEHSNVIDLTASVSLAIYSNIDTVAAGIIHPLINVTVADIITNSTKFHKSPLYRTCGETADKAL